MERKARLMDGQNRAPNTIKLRNEYTKFKVDQETEGNSVPKFEEWVKEKYPDKKILVQ